MVEVGDYGGYKTGVIKDRRCFTASRLVTWARIERCPVAKVERKNLMFVWPCILNRLTPNDSYMGLTAPLTSKRCILYIYSTNISIEYFKHVLYSPFFFSSKCSLFHNANLFGSCIIHILYTECAKLKKNNNNNNSGAKGLIWNDFVRPNWCNNYHLLINQ